MPHCRREEWGVFGKILMTVIPEDAVSELTRANLNEALDYIRVNGGLGLIHFQKDCEHESLVKTALENECGYCSEKSTVLYVAFIKAGLSAEFGRCEPNGNNPQGHSFVILKLKDKMRHFDPTWENSDAEKLHEIKFREWRPQTNREFTATRYANLGADYQQEKNYEDENYCAFSM